MEDNAPRVTRGRGPARLEALGFNAPSAACADFLNAVKIYAVDQCDDISPEQITRRPQWKDPYFLATSFVDAQGKIFWASRKPKEPIGRIPGAPVLSESTRKT